VVLDEAKVIIGVEEKQVSHRQGPDYFKWVCCALFDVFGQFFLFGGGFELSKESAGRLLAVDVVLGVKVSVELAVE
jgi:hypothetical protein